MRDLDSLHSWHADWTNLRVAVLGLGMTGFSVADTLAELGANVLVVTERASDERRAILEVLHVGLVIPSSPSDVPAELVEFEPELIVASPGYAPDHPLLVWAGERGIPVWGDIELAWRVRDKVRAAEWISVTGTNGKTTTAQLTEHMIRASGARVAAVGNIGVPVLDAVRDPEGFDVLVVELSSYQLHWVPAHGVGSLAPLASVCLNIADDHLDWHGSREAYRAAKGKVYSNTRIACVYNKADSATMELVEDAEVQEGCRAIGFDLGVPGPSDLGLVDGILVDRAFHDDRHSSALEITTMSALTESGLASPHMVANVLAASALARAWGVTPETIRDALVTFRPDSHRSEAIAFASDVLWVDDSKATNPHAADASLRGFESVVWIVGGLLKGVDISDLVRTHTPRLRSAIVIGTDRTALLAAFARHAPALPVFEVEASETDHVMPEAIRFAASVVSAGDVVLLAPAAASMDQFTDYADRGRRFASAVEDHMGGARDDGNTTPTRPTDGA